METEYLNNAVGIPLARCLAEVVAKQPEDPIEWIAQWLYKYTDSEMYFYEKSIYLQNLQATRAQVVTEMHNRHRDTNLLEAQLKSMRMLVDKMEDLKQRRIKKYMENLRNRPQDPGYSQDMARLRQEAAAAEAARKEAARLKAAARHTPQMKSVTIKPASLMKYFKPVRKGQQSDPIDARHIDFMAPPQQLDVVYGSHPASPTGLDVGRLALENLQALEEYVKLTGSLDAAETHKKNMLEHLKSLTAVNMPDVLAKEHRGHKREVRKHLQSMMEVEDQIRNTIRQSQDSNIKLIESRKTLASEEAALRKHSSDHTASDDYFYDDQSDSHASTGSAGIAAGASPAERGSRRRSTRRKSTRKPSHRPSDDEERNYDSQRSWTSSEDSLGRRSTDGGIKSDSHKRESHRRSADHRVQIVEPATPRERSSVEAVKKKWLKIMGTASWSLDCNLGLVCDHTILGQLKGREAFVPPETPELWVRQGYLERTLYDPEIYSDSNTDVLPDWSLFPHLTLDDFRQSNVEEREVLSVDDNKDVQDGLSRW